MLTLNQPITFSVTGVVASERISPLLPSDWKNTTESPDIVPDFLWENAPRRETKGYRDTVKAYSHLPNGTSLLDSKWALGRLFATARDESDRLLVSLETHCFRGLDGFQAFARKVQLLGETAKESYEMPFADYADIQKGLDLSAAPDGNKVPPLWVVKDATANGAGGIWVVGPETAAAFASPGSTPLYPEHRYVAQRYAWPPVLFGGRKCHVRVYGLLTSDGKAFVHHRAFLHVANDPFTTSDASRTGTFQDSIHITNCCANSHDNAKFAGEILADFEQTESMQRDGQTVVPLAAFFPSVRKCIAFLAEKAFPFLQGGQANHGFEYMGIDFMLSYNQFNEPVAYILEINAPPSQDSATGLPHAENLHNEVIRDLTTLWVLPHVAQAPAIPGGWRCVYTSTDVADVGDLIAPSKAAIINKIRWTMFEKKAQREEDEAEIALHAQNGTESPMNVQCQGHEVAEYARSQFPFFSDVASHRLQVFFESAGGSQVTQQVIEAVTMSLSHRHRSIIGSKTKEKARESIRRILGTRGDEPVILGPNATTLLATLADKYVRNGLLRRDDEVIVSTENHSANYDPWLRAAKDSGATLKLWTPFGKTTVEGTKSSNNLEDLVTSKTRIVTLPHASNVLGQIRDLKSLTYLIKTRSKGYAHIVVDGVAAVPHYFADLAYHNDVDWYVISCHKLFGPHLGALCANHRGTVQNVITGSSPGADDSKFLYGMFEDGTVNYEGCAGVVGLGNYFLSLANFAAEQSKQISNIDSPVDPSLSSGELCAETQTAGRFQRLLQDFHISNYQVKEAYRLLRLAESPLVNALLQGLGRSKKVRILGNDDVPTPPTCLVRLPTISFVHETIQPVTILNACEANGIICRYSSFLCTSSLAQDLGFDHSEGVVRVSLAHYNTMVEVDLFFKALAGIPGWF